MKEKLLPPILPGRITEAFVDISNRSTDETDDLRCGLRFGPARFRVTVFQSGTTVSGSLLGIFFAVCFGDFLGEFSTSFAAANNRSFRD